MGSPSAAEASGAAAVPETAPPPRRADQTWLVVGLGNPGPGYAATRHNIGQMAIDELATRIGAPFRGSKANAVVAEGRMAPGAEKLILAKPLSFMNNSGGPVSQLLKFYTLAPANLIVLHDEIDLPFDALRLKIGGGHGGHNGIRDIAAAVGPEFARVRIGVGRPPGTQDAADYVLKAFSSTERKTLPSLISDAADATELLISDGLQAAQQRWHSPRD